MTTKKQLICIDKLFNVTQIRKIVVENVNKYNLQLLKK